MKSISILSYLVETDNGGKGKDTLLVETGIGGKGKDLLLVETCYVLLVNSSRFISIQVF
jgi:hypothetical protein